MSLELAPTHRLLAQRVAVLCASDDMVTVQYSDGSRGDVPSSALVSLQAIAFDQHPILKTIT